MPGRNNKRLNARLGAKCDCNHSSFPVRISSISCEGCSLEAGDEWTEDFDFIHLKIDDRVDINGCLLWHKGRCAGVRFFGQIHPFVVKELERAAA